MAALVGEQILAGFSGQAVRKQQRKRKRAQMEGERDTLLQGGPGIEIQEEKPSFYQEESKKFSSSCTSPKEPI
eukprot:4173739-Amphidinium_carterae.1